jgi:hypothetical protein
MQYNRRMGNWVGGCNGLDTRKEIRLALLRSWIIMASSGAHLLLLY